MPLFRTIFASLVPIFVLCALTAAVWMILESGDQKKDDA